MCRSCAFLYYDRPRCPSVDPKTGFRCGLWTHHRGSHNAITPSDAPWFGELEAREVPR